MKSLALIAVAASLAGTVMADWQMFFWTAGSSCSGTRTEFSGTGTQGCTAVPAGNFALSGSASAGTDVTLCAYTNSDCTGDHTSTSSTSNCNFACPAGGCSSGEQLNSFQVTNTGTC